jgi:type II secretory pathway component GspD/PulD (secretin)
MKPMKKIMLLIGLAGALFAATAVVSAQDATPPQPPAATNGDDQGVPPPPPDDATPAPDAPAAPVTVATPPPAPAAPIPVAAYTPDTNVIIPVPAGVKGLRFNFRNAPLEAVLKYMSAAAGFIIHPKTDVTGKVTVWADQPLDSDEAVKQLTQILNDNGYTLLAEGRTLTIIRTSDAKTSDIRVLYGADPAQIPKNAEIVTQIIPVHSLNVVQLVKDLQPLEPSDTTITADDAANSLVITGTQMSIHRFAEIIKALDSVNSSAATVKVYPLKYADSKSLATLITTLFPNPDNANGRGGASPFGRFRGGGGGGGFGGFNPFGGGAPGGDADSNNGHTPTAKVSAVSDDHGNALVVSAPDSLIPTIDDLVNSVDTPVEDTTMIKVFHLKNADPSEMADLLTSLYPDDTGSTDASRQQPRFGFGGFFGGGGGGRQTGDTPSDRMKKMSHVSAVADKRTSSLVVTAATNVMNDIANMIDDLDSRNDHKMSVHIIPLVNADPIDVQNILQDLYTAPSTSGSSRSGSSTSASTSNPLLNRQTTLLQQQNNTATSSSFGSGSGSGSTGRGF